MQNHRNLTMTILQPVEVWHNVLSLILEDSWRHPALSHTEKTVILQKQPSRGVLWKRCFENMQQIYSRTPIPKCDFNKVTWQLY